jgi:iron-sulfur cluster repair protein YtfE (RIC family)
MRRRDPLDELSHDHGHLGALVLSVQAALLRIERGELTFDEGVEELDDAVESLRDALLDHFAREEEGFFPFVSSHVVALQARVDALREDHDAVCRRVDDLSRAVRQGVHEGVGLALCRSTFDRFQELYAKHAQAELALLVDVNASVDGAARDQLRAILAAI